MFFMIVCLLFSSDSNSLSLIDKITLSPIESIMGDMDKILVNQQGMIFVFSYWNSNIHMFDATGRFLKTIARAGEGPGEVRKPKYIFSTGDNKMIAIEADPPKAHVFDFESGKYLKLIRGLPGSNMWASNGLDFVALQNGRFDDELWAIFDQSFASKTKFGKQEPNPVFQFYSRRYALAFDKNGNIYYQEGYMPSLHVYNKSRPDYHEWKLRPPEHFKKFERPMDTRVTGFSREKSHLHMSSFTHLNRLSILDNRIMMIEWLTWEPSLKSWDFYDLNTRRLLLANFRNDGEIATTMGMNIYFLQLPPDEKSEKKPVLYKYRFKE